MADRNRTDEEEDVSKGGIEHVIQEVASGEEPSPEIVDEVYQFRQRIVSSDNPQDVIEGEREKASSANPKPLPPPEEK
ncbi:MAG TPA: hypothetical protein VF221_15380 [Chloroflexota bacterium]